MYNAIQPTAVVICGMLSPKKDMAQPDPLWTRCLFGTDIDCVLFSMQTSDDGFLSVGSTGSINGDVTGYFGGRDERGAEQDAAVELQRVNSLGGSYIDDDRSGNGPPIGATSWLGEFGISTAL